MISCWFGYFKNQVNAALIPSLDSQGEEHQLRIRDSVKMVEVKVFG